MGLRSRPFVLVSLLLCFLLIAPGFAAWNTTWENCRNIAMTESSGQARINDLFYADLSTASGMPLQYGRVQNVSCEAGGGTFEPFNVVNSTHALILANHTGSGTTNYSFIYNNTTAAYGLNTNITGLRVYYPMDEGAGTSVKDFAGNVTNDGQYFGANWNATGKYGTAISCDGTDDYLNVTSKRPFVFMNNNNWTIEVWSRTKSTGAKHSLNRIQSGANPTGQFYQSDNFVTDPNGTYNAVTISASDKGGAFTNTIDVQKWNYKMLGFDSSQANEVQVRLTRSNGTSYYASYDAGGSNVDDTASGWLRGCAIAETSGANSAPTTFAAVELDDLMIWNITLPYNQIHNYSTKLSYVLGAEQAGSDTEAPKVSITQPANSSIINPYRTLINVLAGDDSGSLANVSIYGNWTILENATCYQGKANVSTACGGMDTGTYGINASLSLPASVDVNYTKPNNLTSAIVTVRHGTAPQYNISIRSQEINYNAQNISFRMIGTETGNSTTVFFSRLEIYNGSWTPIGTPEAASGTIGWGMGDVTYFFDESFSTRALWRPATGWTFSDSGTGGPTGNFYEMGLFWNVTILTNYQRLTNTSPYNNTNATFNITGLTEGQTYSFYAEACDTTGNCNTTSNYTITIDSTDPTITSIFPANNTFLQTPGSYSFNATFGGTNLNTTWIAFDNGTNFTLSSLGSGIYGTTITNPALGNYSFRMWANDSASNTVYSDNYTVAAYAPFLGLCNATYPIPALYFFMQTEELGTSVNGTLEWNGTVTTGAQTYSFNGSLTNNTTAFCINPASSTFDINMTTRYYNTTAAYRQYILRNAQLTNATNNITLFLEDAPATINVTNYVVSAGQYLQAIVQYYRYFIPINTFRLVDMAETSATSGGITKLQPYNTQYRVVVLYSNGSIAKIFSPITIDATSKTYDITTGQIGAYWDVYDTVAATCASSNSSQTITCTALDTSGVGAAMTFQVTRQDPLTETVVCSNTTSAISATFSCNLGNTTDQSFNYGLTVDTATAGELLLSSGKLDGQKTNTFALSGLFLSFLIVVGIAAVGAFNPAAMVIFAFAGLILSYYTGLALITRGGLIAVGVVVALIIYRLRT